MSDLRSRVLGTIFGTLSRGTFPQRNPVAWLYNGVRLPGLPEEITAFKYRFIEAFVGGDLTAYYVTAFDEEPSVYIENLNGSDSLATKYYGTNGKKVAASYATTSPGHDEWLVLPTTEMSISAALEGYLHKEPGLIWSNNDVVDLDGSIILAASDPVSVYE